jgi:hypothetical protein
LYVFKKYVPHTSKQPKQQENIEKQPIIEDVENGLVGEKSMKIVIKSDPTHPDNQENTLYSPVVVLSRINNTSRSIYGTLTLENVPGILKRTLTPQSKPPLHDNENAKNIIQRKKTSQEKKSVLDIDFGDTMDENQFSLFIEGDKNETTDLTIER